MDMILIKILAAFLALSQEALQKMKTLVGAAS